MISTRQRPPAKRINSAARTARLALDEARAHRAAGRRQTAAVVCRQILARYPDNAAAHHLLGLLLRDEGGVAAGLPHLKLAVENGPGAPAHWEAFIEALVDTGRRDAALRALDQAAAWLPTGTITRLKARCRQNPGPDMTPLQALLNAGRFAELENACRHQIERCGAQLPLMRILALALMQVDKPEDALAWIDRALAQVPDDGLLLNQKGVVFKRLGNAEVACSLFRRALLARPEDPTIHANLGDVLLTLGDTSAGENWLRSALVFTPGAIGVRTKLANALLGQGRQQEAFDLLVDHAGSSCDDPGALLAFGTAAAEIGKLPTAERSYRRAIDLSPVDSMAWQNLGSTLVHLDRLTEAETCLRRGAALDPHSDLAWSRLGHCLARLEKFGEAEECLRHALDLNYSRRTRHFLGSILRLAKRYAEAETVFEALIREDPTDAKAHARLGVVLARRGHATRAVACCRAALAIDGENIDAHMGLIPFTRATPGARAFDLLYGAVDQATSSTPHRINAHFHLGRLHTDIGAYERAFEHYKAANDLLVLLRDYDAEAARRPDQDPAILANLFDRARFDAFDGAGCQEDLPVFVVGMPRSGKSLSEQIMACHEAVVAGGERNDLQSLLLAFKREGGASYADVLARLTPARAREIGQAYVDRIRKAGGPGARHVVDTQPPNLWLLGMIGLILPRAPIVLCGRDPLDLGWSCYCKNFESRVYTFTSDLTALGEKIRDTERIMDHWAAVLPNPVVRIRYEDLVSHPADSGAALTSALGINWRPDLLDALSSADNQVECLGPEHSLDAPSPLRTDMIGISAPFRHRLAPLQQALDRGRSRIHAPPEGF